ncbi:MAG: ABC transporter permease [Acutalibacteraceae bacterium]|nr:ABC transporter permease [Acutalibacteraceae bacterium]
MSGLISRNLKIFFRDKGAVIFSLLGVLIVAGLNILFLGDAYTDSLADFEGAKNIVSSWVMSGLLAITSVTTTMGAFGTMVQDKERKIFKDFYCAPISRSSITLSYIISSAIVGLIMTGIVLIIAVVYLTANEAITLSATMFIKLIATGVLTALSNTAMVLFLVSLVNSSKANGALSGVISALIGFVTGIYLPIGNLPEGVQYVVKCFPTSHSAVLFRQILMGDMKDSVAKFPPQAQTEALNGVKEAMGVVFKFGETECTSFASVMVLVATLVIFSALSVIVLRKKKNG